MKRIRAGIALITLCGLLFGTAGIAKAKTASPVHHVKVSQTTTTHHTAKSHISKKSVHKSAKMVKSVKAGKVATTTAKTKLKAKIPVSHLIHA